MLKSSRTRPVKVSTTNNPDLPRCVRLQTTCRLSAAHAGDSQLPGLSVMRVALPVRAVQAFIMNRLRNVPINDIAELQGVKKSTVYNDCNLVWDFLKVTVKHMVNEY